MRGLLNHLVRVARVAAAGLLATFSVGSFADTISPPSFSGSLAIGESVTVRHTVTVDTAPSTALIDIMFVFDTTGSMGSAINNAKASATNVLNALSSFGSVHSGVGQYDDPGSRILNNLTSSIATTQASINSLFAGFGSGGGDAPEVGYAGIRLAANSATWRPGSNRFIVAFGDATFKTGPLALDTQSGTLAALAANNIKLFGLSFGTPFNGAITGLGGSIFAGGSSATTVANAITAGVTAGLSTYTSVGMGDLGDGLSQISTSVACVNAGGGTCSGAIATGSFDRTVARSFEFDVTWTRVADGDKTFDMRALVDGGTVATELVSFVSPGGGTPGSAVSAPSSLALAGLALLGLGIVRRRRA